MWTPSPALPLDGKRVIAGTFVKTDSPLIVEILGTTNLDFVVADAEHAPIDRIMLDRMVMAGRSVNLPVVVRLPDHAPATVLAALDLGVSGLLIPHIENAAQAKDVVSRARFRDGTRGISLSGRFAGFGGLPRDQAILQGDAVPVLCQIECAGGLAAVEDIAAVEGVAGLFIGRSDLALSLGLADPASPQITAAAIRIATAARAAGKTAAMAVGSPAEIATFTPHGVTCFVVGSDQSLLRNGALDIASATARARS